MPSSDTGNIFLTTENLAFSVPLIAVCSIYAYFHFLPLQFSVAGVVLVFVAVQIQSKLKARKNNKLTHLDENAILDIVGEEEENEALQAREAAKHVVKAKNRIKSRLAQEKKIKTTAGKKSKKGDDDDDVDMTAFVKGSRGSNVKKSL